jgi:hypothetical protein
LQEPEARRRRKTRAPVKADDDFGLGQRRGKPGEVGIVGEDLGVRRGGQAFHDARRDAGGKAAEKQCLHLRDDPSEH